MNAIARCRRWLDDVVSGRVTTIAQLCAREECSVRQVNMTISVAFLAPNLVKAAVAGRLPRGISIERFRDPPTEWSRQSEALGLNRNTAAQPRISNYSNAKGRFTGACAVGLHAQGWPPGTEFLDAETGRQKSPPKWVNAGRDQNPGCEWPEIPAERPYLASYRKRAVCGDWMVVCAVICEPVSLLFGQYQGDFRK